VNKNKEKQSENEGSASEPATLDLRGRQSVRATFRLSEACIEAISILSAQLGIKQKSVFDHLMEDDRGLNNMARDLENTKFDRHERIQKTFVVSRRSLTFLDMISRRHNAPRDALVEYSVRRLWPIIANERAKHQKRKVLLTEIADHFAEGENLLLKAAKDLGTDDPIVDKLETAMSVYRNALDAIAHFVERGKIIEEFEP
jgi:hypothetical protein